MAASLPDLAGVRALAHGFLNPVTNEMHPVMTRGKTGGHDDDTSPHFKTTALVSATIDDKRGQVLRQLLIYSA
ncbi:hypothetical protein ACOJBO_09350 [Rhizobium beringeri]